MCRTKAGLVAILALSLAACNKAGSTASSEAQKTANALTGNAATNPECKKFTQAEIAGFAGTPVEAGGSAAGGTGCQWPAQNGKGFVMVQLVRAKDHNPPSGAPGFKELPDIGKGGFIVPDDNGFSAGTIQGNDSINIMISTGASDAQTVAFLREVMKRTNSLLEGV